MQKRSKINNFVCATRHERAGFAVEKLAHTQAGIRTGDLDSNRRVRSKLGVVPSVLFRSYVSFTTSFFDETLRHKAPRQLANLDC